MIKRIIVKYITPLAIVLCSLNAQARWVTATGVGNDQNEAVNDALENVMMQVGADVKLVQEYKNGVLQNDSFQMKAKDPIKKVQILEAQATAQKVTVTIKAFIMDNQVTKRCSTSSIQKTLVPVGFKFVDSQAYQSSMGIENIPKELDKLIFDKINSSPKFVTKSIVNANIINNNGKYVDDNFKMNNLQAIASRSNAQYVIVGTINSLALSEVGNNFLTKMIYYPTRSINFDVDVYDTLNQTQIFHQNYQAETDWLFKQDEYIDIRSDRFTGSDYGQRLHSLAARAAKDVIYELECKKVYARVIDIDGDDLIINIGSDSRLNIGQVFSLIQRSAELGNQGDQYDVYENTQGKYKVTAVYPHSAKIHPVDLNNNTLNVNSGDLVSIE